MEKKGWRGREPKIGRLLPGQVLLLFWVHYIEDGPHLLCTVHFRWLLFTENKGEGVANYIKEEGYLQM